MQELRCVFDPLRRLGRLFTWGGSADELSRRILPGDLLVRVTGKKVEYCEATEPGIWPTESQWTRAPEEED